MKLNGIIISSDDLSTYSHSAASRLKVNEETASIQLIKSLVDNKGALDNETLAQQKDLNWQTAPKLNGIALYSYLSGKGLNCEIIDCYASEKQRFLDLVQHQPDFIIISTTFIPLKHALIHLVAQIRKVTPKIPIIAGGPFIFSSYLLYKQKDNPDYDTDSAAQNFLFLDDTPQPDIDYYVIGSQGLQALHALLKCITNKASTKDLSNIAYYRNGEFVVHPVQEVECFEKVKIDWQQVPDHIFSTGVINIQASNGCPYNCRYCNFVKDPGSTFIRPIDDIVDDLMQLQGKGIRYVRFVDDNFRLGKPDLKEVCEKIIRAGVNIKWMSFMRIDNLFGFDINLLKQAGCVEVQFGLESAHPQILKNMTKNVNPDYYYPVIQDLMRHGINVSATFIIGFPGETRETAKTTIDFIKSIDFDEAPGYFSWSVFSFTILPLSPIYAAKERAEYNLEGYLFKWRHDTMDVQTARNIIDNAYQEIESSSPTYTGDNLDLLYDLSPQNKKAFLLTRHRLSKLALDNPLTPEEIANAFRACLVD